MNAPRSALFSSPFRPFFLLGTLYGLLLMLSWVPFYTGLVQGLSPSGSNLPVLYHQHEIVFGFSTAIIFGFIMTALPSWAGTEEITGPRLALLTLSWMAGRLSIALSSMLPLPVVAILDLSFPLLFALLVAPGLSRTRFEYKLGLSLIAAGFFAGNLCYYVGIFEQEQSLWLQGLRIGVYAMIFHCSVTVGVLAPVFTENALLESGRPTPIGHIATLEWLSALSIVALAIADIGGAGPAANGVLALLCGLLHAVRLARWRSFSIASAPIAWVLHLGYLWLVVSLGLRAVAEFTPVVGTEAWVHAFTIGGFGLMSLGLMTRVTLRHTGRKLTPAAAMVAGYLCVAVAALIRVIIPATSLRHELLLLSALLWVIPYLLYLTLYGRMLLTPSLPR